MNPKTPTQPSAPAHKRLLCRAGIQRGRPHRRPKQHRKHLFCTARKTGPECVCVPNRWKHPHWGRRFQEYLLVDGVLGPPHRFALHGLPPGQNKLRPEILDRRNTDPRAAFVRRKHQLLQREVGGAPQTVGDAVQNPVQTHCLKPGTEIHGRKGWFGAFLLLSCPPGRVWGSLGALEPRRNTSNHPLFGGLFRSVFLEL